MDLQEFAYNPDNLQKSFTYQSLSIKLVRYGVHGGGTYSHQIWPVEPLYEVTVGDVVLTVSDIRMIQDS